MDKIRIVTIGGRRYPDGPQFYVDMHGGCDLNYEDNTLTPVDPEAVRTRAITYVELQALYENIKLSLITTNPEEV